MHWLNPQAVYWDDWILFAAQIFTLIALVVYVWKTWQMAVATRLAAESSAAAVREAIDAPLEALAPRILVYFGSEDLLLAEVVVENRGQGTAVDLVIRFDPPLQASRPDWNPNRFFDTPKSVFTPGYRITHSLDSWPAYFGANTPRRYEVHLSYRGKENGRRYEDVQILDVASIEHRTEFGRKNMDDLVRQVEKATSALEDGFKKLLDELQLRLATEVYLHEPARFAVAYARELVAAWDAGNRIEEAVHTRFWWEPLLRSMRTLAFQGYQAAVRDGNTPLRNALIAVAALVFVPSYVTNRDWEQELTRAIEELRTLLQLPEAPRLDAPPV